MMVVFGDESLKLIEEKYTALELDTILFEEGKEPSTQYAVITPGDIPFENFVRLGQFLPVHEALIKNYKKGDMSFCIQAIQKLLKNIDPFMDSFYKVLLIRCLDQLESPDDIWEPTISLEQFQDENAVPLSDRT